MKKEKLKVINFKVTEADYNDIWLAACQFGADTLSDWLREAGMKYKPKKNLLKVKNYNR